ncbi:hypothetical protein CNMCM5793_007745 [Aspergillus hiratsukae]|uniref:Uncharacterized protein n=1 Tax=Aspergillus hiratsukae TaxID=1194566 RepID=A0A8H6PRI4_9EURO|nr:hypothetical protein CNMCM5793_007745 [Aspergillus hiratsukae]KAF7159009.1 hypothetical protein CNMCM6106_006102 [Aspergillus hiratsukae]
MPFHTFEDAVHTFQAPLSTTATRETQETQALKPILDTRLDHFVLQLNDQQPVTELFLLVCGYAQYWGLSVLDVANNLWTVTDVVCYPSFTHAAALLPSGPTSSAIRSLLLPV